jgi:DNA gyrase inhibitor GyrI
MERAVMYLQTEEYPLTALAEKVGYDNPQSFSKAFKKQFGLSPKRYANELNARLENQVKIGDKTDYPKAEICEEKDLNLVYIRIIGKYGEDEPYETAWNKLVGFLKSNRLLTGNTRFIGLSFDDPNVTKPSLCRFYACAVVQEEIVPTREFGTIRLPRGKYAVYTLKGSYTGLQALYDHISVHLEYPIRHGMAFEEYLNSPEDTPENEFLTKVFIPIQ